MKKMKSMIAVFTALTMMLTLTACSSGKDTGTSPAPDPAPESSNKTEDPAPATSGETYVLKLATSMTKEEALGQQMEILADKIQKYTNNQVSVETYYNGELGSSSDMTEMVQQGANVFSFETLDFYASYSYDLSILDGPFFFYEPEEMRTLEKSEWWQEQMTGLAESNIYCLGTIYFGARSLIHKAGAEADAPSDFKGVCMRTANTPMRYAM